MRNIEATCDITTNESIYPLPNILQITIGKDCIISIEEIENDDNDLGNYVIVDC